MQIYDRTVICEGRRVRLKAIRLPNSWYAVLWGGPEAYAAVSQKANEANGGAFTRLDDDAFLGHVRLTFDFEAGIRLEFTEPHRLLTRAIDTLIRTHGTSTRVIGDGLTAWDLVETDPALHCYFKTLGRDPDAWKVVAADVRGFRLRAARSPREEDRRLSFTWTAIAELLPVWRNRCCTAAEAIPAIVQDDDDDHDDRSPGYRPPFARR